MSREVEQRFEPLYGKLQAIGRAYPDPSTYSEKACPQGLKPFRMMAWNLVRTAREKPDELLGPFVNHGGIMIDRTLWGPPSDYLKLSHGTHTNPPFGSWI
jgi:hypothetical protein